MELELTDEIEDPLSLKSIQNLTMIFSYHSSLTECVWKCQGDAQCIGEFYHPRRFYLNLKRLRLPKALSGRWTR